MSIVKKEAKETKYWLKLIKANNTGLYEKIESLEANSEELIKIISKIIINSSS